MPPYFIRSYRQTTKSSKIILSSTMLYLLGMLLGFISGHLLKNSLYATIKESYDGILTNLSVMKIPFAPLCLLCFKNQCKESILLIFFSFTNVWLFYLCSYLLYRGFTSGLLLLFCTMLQGVSGIWEFFCFLMPQALIYIPAYLCLIQRLQTNRQESKKGISPLHEIPIFLFLFLLLLLGCVLESLVNLPLLRWYHGL